MNIFTNAHVKEKNIKVEKRGKEQNVKIRKIDFLMKKLGEFENYDAGWDCQSVTRMIINRFYQRVLKYQSRGIKTVYTKQNYVLPWMVNRFRYKDFTNVRNQEIE